MRKIKNFRIPVYTYDILRRARKHKLDLAAAGLAGEEAAREYVAALAATVEPSTVFLHLQAEDPVSAKILGRQARMTVGVLTLGPGFEARLSCEKEETLLRLDRLAGAIFLETGVNVVCELLGKEAEPEGFDLESPVYIHSAPPQESAAAQAEPTAVPLFEGELIKELFERMETSKIGVGFDSGAFAPRYLAIFAIPWAAKKKKKAESKKTAA